MFQRKVSPSQHEFAGVALIQNGSKGGQEPGEILPRITAAYVEEKRALDRELASQNFPRLCPVSGSELGTAGRINDLDAFLGTIELFTDVLFRVLRVSDQQVRPAHSLPGRLKGLPIIPGLPTLRFFPEQERDQVMDVGPHRACLRSRNGSDFGGVEQIESVPS